MTATSPSRGILMQGDMVRAILDDRKRKTRRLRGLKRLNSGPYKDCVDRVDCRDGVWHFWQGEGSSAVLLFKAKCPYGVPGDLLYVKETFAVLEGVGVKYKADNPSQDKPSEYWETPLASSLSMPKERSRITLEITAVRPEPVQDISEEDAIAEGCYHGPGAGNYRDARHIYEGLWDSINAKTFPWISNPWVWAISFRRMQ